MNPTYQIGSVREGEAMNSEYAENPIELALAEWARNYEPVVIRGAGMVTPREIGEALRQIRDLALYKEVDTDFYVYCAKRWGMRPDRVNAYIRITDDVPLPDEEDQTTSNDDDPGRIYFIVGEGLVKIGHSINLDRRFKELQNMSPVPVSMAGSIAGSMAQERKLHAQFEHLRRHGEWFELDQNLLSYIRTTLANNPIIPMTAVEARSKTNQIKFKATETRQLLLEMHEREGWRALGYGSWREYGQAEFGYSERRIYQLMDAAKVERNLTEPDFCTIVQNNDGQIGQSMPESHLRPLTKLENPELQRAAWIHAVKSAPDGHVTAAHVESVVRQMTVPAKPPEPEPVPSAEPVDLDYSEYSLVSSSGTVVITRVKKKIRFFALGKTVFDLDPKELVAGLSYLLGRGIVMSMVFDSPHRPGQEDPPQAEPSPEPEPEPDRLADAVRAAEINASWHQIEEEEAYRVGPRPRPALSHRELAEELQVPINTVAVVRELMARTTFVATDAHRRFDGDLVAAARHLATARRCDQRALDSIDEDVIAAIEEADAGRVLTPEVME